MKTGERELFKVTGRPGRRIWRKQAGARGYRPIWTSDYVEEVDGKFFCTIRSESENDLPMEQHDNLQDALEWLMRDRT